MLSSKWRLLGGIVALLGSAIGQLAQYLVAPAHVSGGTAADQVAAVAGHDSRINAAIWLDLPILLVIPAALYLGLVAGARTSRLAATGAAITFVGSLGAGYLLALDPLIALAGRVEPRDGAVALVSAYESSAVANVMVVVGVLGTALGYILLGVAMFRTRTVARWVGLAVVVSVVLEVGGQAVGIDAVAVAAYVIRVVAFVMCAAALVRLRREAPGLAPSALAPAAAAAA